MNASTINAPNSTASRPTSTPSSRESAISAPPSTSPNTFSVRFHVQNIDEAIARITGLREVIQLLREENEALKTQIALYRRRGVLDRVVQSQQAHAKTIEAARYHCDIVINNVCDHYRIPIESITAYGRTALIARARQAAIYLCRELGYSYPILAQVFLRDEGSIIQACRTCQAAVDTEPAHAAAIASIREKFKLKNAQR